MTKRSSRRRQRAFIGTATRAVIDSLEQRQMLSAPPTTPLHLLSARFDSGFTEYSKLNLTSAPALTAPPLLFRFDDNVSGTFQASLSDIEIHRVGSSTLATIQSISFDASGTVAIISLGSDFGTGSWQATLHATGIARPNGPTLAADTTIDFSYTQGDISGDGVTDFTDLLALARNYGKPGVPTTGDLNNDGLVDFSDLLALARGYGTGTLNLAIDSNNSGSNPSTSSGIERVADEDGEADPALPGKILATSTGDSDRDGIPDDLDGFNRDTLSGSTADDVASGLTFVPIQLRLPTGSFGNPRLRFTYSGSDPAGATSSEPASGYLRLWTKDGSQARNAATDYIVPGQAYQFSQIASGLAAGGVVTLYVEAVRPSAQQGDLSIRVELDPNYSTSFAPQYADVVRLTAVNPVAAYLNDPTADRPGEVATGSDGGDPMSLGYSGAVRLADGAAIYSSTDIAPTDSGIVSGFTRTWNGSTGLRPGPNQGSGWIASQQPSLIFSGNAVGVINGGRSTIWFDAITSGSSTTYRARNYELDTLAVDSDTGRLVWRDTAGNAFNFFRVADANTPLSSVGQLDTIVDSDGNTTKYGYLADGTLRSIERWQGQAGNSGSPQSLLEQVLFTYIPKLDTSGSAVVRNDPSIVGKLMSVEVRRRLHDTDMSPTIVQKSLYDYYLSASSYGSPGDLRGVRVFNYATGTTAVEAEHKYYRYDTTGGTSRLSSVFEGASFERMAKAVGWTEASSLSVLDDSSDSMIQPYADLVLRYDAQGRVSDQFIQGERKGESDVNVESSPGVLGSLGARHYVYVASNAKVGRNQWSYKTREILPGTDATADTSDDYTDYYLNTFGELIASNFVSAGTSWRQAWVLDSDGRVLQHATPAAADGSVAINESLANPVTIRATEGLIEVSTYGASTSTPPAATTAGSSGGDAPNYLKSVGVARGANGVASFIKTLSFGYGVRPHSSTYVLKSESAYRSDAVGSTGITTVFDYSFYSGTDRVKKLTTRLPGVAGSQNGRNSASDQEVSVFDVFGHETWHQDGDGYINGTTYNVSLGGIVAQTIDAAVGTSGLVRPAGLPSPLAFTSSMQLDGLGRTTSSTDPRGYATTTTYYDDAAIKRVLTTLPPVLGGGASPPQLVTQHDRGAGTVSVYKLGVGNHVLALTKTQLDPQNRESISDRYVDTTVANATYDPATNALSGSLGASYQTSSGYDFRGRLDRTAVNREVTGTPRITRTVYDGLNRPRAVFVGTDDTGWTGLGGGNLVETTLYDYDGGGAGNSDLTYVTQVPGGSAALREIHTAYDWRDRAIATRRGGQSPDASDTNTPVTYVKYDNLDRAVAKYVFDGDGLTDTNLVADANADGVPDMPASGRMREATLTQYDDRGLVYRTATFDVSQGDGTSDTNGGPSSSDVYSNTADQFAALTDTQIASIDGLRTNMWFDNRGNTIKTQVAGGLVNKVRYDGADRPIVAYVSDGGMDATYDNATNVDNDNVLEQVETSYDADGNVIFSVTRQRHHDETLTGALGNDTTAPEARVSYVGQWYDEDDRPITTVNWGNNGGTAIASRPATAPARASSDGWDPYLRTDQSYDESGRLKDSTDPRGIVTRHQYDSLDRQVLQYEAYQDGVPGNTSTKDDDRKTLWSYNGFDQLASTESQTFEPTPTGGVQVRSLITTYTYGVTVGGGSQINDPSLLNQVSYSRAAGGAAISTESYNAYDALGENLKRTATDTAVHEYTYDTTGALRSDTVTNATLPSTMETNVRKLSYGYDVLGRGIRYTTEGYPIGSTTYQALNEVKRAYDGLGNLTTEWQEHNGTVITSGASASLAVRYVYDTNYASNYSRQTRLVYPDGRVLWTGYDDTDLNDAISRPGYTADSQYDGSGNATSPETTDIEQLQYLGLSTVVDRHIHDSVYGDDYYVGVTNDDLWQDPEVDDGGASDPYDGLDRFGRVISYGWDTLDTRTYAYDADGDVLYANAGYNQNAIWRSDLYQADGASANDAYDKLGRLKEYQRGILEDNTSDPNGRYDSADTTTELRPIFIPPSYEPVGDATDTIETHYRDQHWETSAATSGYYDRVQTAGETDDPANRNTFQRRIPTGTISRTGDPDETVDLFAQFDAWGRLSYKGTATLQDTAVFGDDHSYDPNSDNPKDEQTFMYDALGRRITESRDVATSTSTSTFLGTTHLYYDASGNVIEERNQASRTNPASTIKYQYVRSIAGSNLIVARDDNFGDNEYGKPGSGLTGRFWVQQGPDGSTWQIFDNDDPNNRVQYLYTPEGQVLALHQEYHDYTYYNPSLDDYEDFPGTWYQTVDSDPDVSLYDFRYLWKGMRAEVHSALAEDGSEVVDQYDGLYWSGSGEIDSWRGGPLDEDASAYSSSGNSYDQWVPTSTNYPANGTSGSWASPGSTLDAFFHPSSYGALSQVSNTDPYHIAAASRFVGIAALSIASAGLGTTLIAGGAGGLIGGIDSELGGGSFGEGAISGSEFGMGAAGSLSMLPKAAAGWAGLGLAIGGTAYGVATASNDQQRMFRAATGALGIVGSAYSLGFRVSQSGMGSNGGGLSLYRLSSVGVSANEGEFGGNLSPIESGPPSIHVANPRLQIGNLRGAGFVTPSEQFAAMGLEQRGYGSFAGVFEAAPFNEVGDAINISGTGSLPMGTIIDFVSPNVNHWEPAAYNKALFEHALKSGYDWNVADVRALTHTQLEAVKWPSGSFSRVDAPGYVWFRPYRGK